MSCKRKNALYKQFQLNPTTHNKSRYNKYRNKYNFLIKLARKKYFHNKLLSISSDMRKTRTVIKQVISKKKPDLHFSHMKDNTGTYSDPIRIVTQFNYFFANIGPSLANNIPLSQSTLRDFLIGHCTNCFYITPTSPTEVANIVYSSKNSRCEGFDGLCISPIKETIDLIAVPLSHICNVILPWCLPHTAQDS